MRPADKTEKYIRENKITVTSSSMADERILADSTAAMEVAIIKHSSEQKPGIWRIIMQSKITRYSTAACVLAAVICSMVFLDKSVSTVYAVSQTIEALKSVSTVHIVGKDLDGGKVENWVKLDPQTGAVESIFFDYIDRGEVWVSTPTKSYTYYKGRNMVVIRNGPAVNVKITPYKIAELIEQFGNRFGSKVAIKEIYDETLSMDVIVYSVKSPLAGLEFVIDPKTMLPIKGGYTKMLFKNNDEMMKYADQVRYNVQLPEGIFEFKTPQGVMEFNIDLRNELSLAPGYGIEVGDMTKKQACEKIIHAYIQSQLDKDVEAMRKLNAGVDATNLTDEDLLKRVDNDGNPKVQLLSLDEPVVEKGTGWVNVACKIKLQDGSAKDINYNIRFREIDGKESCVITGGK